MDYKRRDILFCLKQIKNGQTVEATIFRHWKTGSTGKPAEAQWGS